MVSLIVERLEIECIIKVALIVSMIIFSFIFIAMHRVGIKYREFG